MVCTLQDLRHHINSLKFLPQQHQEVLIRFDSLAKICNGNPEALLTSEEQSHVIETKSSSKHNKAILHINNCIQEYNDIHKQTENLMARYDIAVNEARDDVSRYFGLSDFFAPVRGGSCKGGEISSRIHAVIKTLSIRCGVLLEYQKYVLKQAKTRYYFPVRGGSNNKDTDDDNYDKTTIIRKKNQTLPVLTEPVLSDAMESADSSSSSTKRKEDAISALNRTATEFEHIAEALFCLSRQQQNANNRFTQGALDLEHVSQVFRVQARKGRGKNIPHGWRESKDYLLLIRLLQKQALSGNLFSLFCRKTVAWGRKMLGWYRTPPQPNPKSQRVNMPLSDKRLTRNREVGNEKRISNLRCEFQRLAHKGPGSFLPVKPDPLGYQPTPSSRFRRYSAGSPEAVSFLSKATWISCAELTPNNNLDQALDPGLIPFLSVIMVPGDRMQPECINMTDLRYRSKAYRAQRRERIRDPTAVLNADTNHVIALFITDACVPVIAETAHKIEETIPLFKRHYPLNKKKISGPSDGAWALTRSERYKGQNWLDGIQIFSSAGRHGRKRGGVYVRPYKRNRDMTADESHTIHTMYAAIQAVEKLISPSMYRRRILIGKRAPRGFPTVPKDIIPATAVGCSSGFSVHTHHDSTRRGICETVLWNGGEVDTAFTVTETRPWLVFDIGKRPCIMLFMGTDEHGTMVSDDPRRDQFYGAVLMSKMRATACKSGNEQMCASIRLYNEALSQEKNLDDLRN